MPATDRWWSRQLFEKMKEASIWYDKYLYQSQKRDMEGYDIALGIYETYVGVYKLDRITLSEFVEIGQSLRIRQALTKIQLENDYES